MNFDQVDKKIQQFIIALNEKLRIIDISKVENVAGREEYQLTVAAGHSMQQCYIWKNPDQTYGWSEFPEQMANFKFQ